MGQVKRQALPVFNNPFELGIRMVYLLQALMPQGRIFKNWFYWTMPFCTPLI